MSSPVRRSHHLLVWAAAALVVVVGGLAAVRVATRDSAGVTVTVDGDTFDGEPASRECSSPALAESLRQGMPTFDYQPSESAGQLAEWSPVVARGQIVNAAESGDGTVIDVKLRDLVGSDGIADEDVGSLWTPATLPPDGVLGGKFVAFLTGEQVSDSNRSNQPAWTTFLEGLWVGCDDTSAAASVLADPTRPGWESLLDGGVSLDDLWRIAQFPQGQISQTIGAPAVVGDGAAVYDLRLIDGERFRLSIPAALAGDLTLTQRPELSPIMIDGPTASIAITFGFCPNQDGMTENRLGSAIATSGGLVNICRPDELLAMVVTPKVNLVDGDLDRFDLRPIALGSRYEPILNAQWPELTSCSNCARWGPMVFPDANVVVNRTGPTSVTAIDLDTLEERWNFDTGDPGDVYMHGGPAGVYLQVTGGAFLKLDPATGRVQWRIERDPGELDLGFSGHAGESWFLRSSFSGEGDDRAPVLRRIDAESGEVLWSALGRQGADWQWARPVVVDDFFVLMDVTDNPQVPVDPTGGTLQAFDIESGRKTWVTDLQSPSEGFDRGLLEVLDSDDGRALLARTIDGDVLRVAPRTGQILWRTPVPFGRFNGTDHSADGTLAVGITTPQGQRLLDPTTGESLTPGASAPPSASKHPRRFAPHLGK
jgi:outer membrane protein assembly factor BamB